jgi:hypothetical protein
VRSPRLELAIRGSLAQNALDARKLYAPRTMATKIVLKVISEIIARQRIA